MYFDEFCLTAKEVTSEFFISIYDCIYNYIPCAKNFLILRSNYEDSLKQNLREELRPKRKLQQLKPPITSKMREKFRIVPDLWS